MSEHWRTETCESWAADFSHGDGAKLFPGAVAEHAQEILGALLTAACAANGREPGALSDEDLKVALLGAVARLQLDPEVRAFVPSLARAFLTDLQAQGRLAEGAARGRYVGALKEAFLAAGGKPATFVRPAEKLGRNELCPCGSGKKFKKCCMGK